MTSSIPTSSDIGEEDLQRNLVKLLLRQMPLLSLANLTLAAAVTYSMWHKLPHTAISIWLIGLIAVPAFAEEVKIGVPSWTGAGRGRKT